MFECPHGIHHKWIFLAQGCHGDVKMPLTYNITLNINIPYCYECLIDEIVGNLQFHHDCLSEKTIFAHPLTTYTIRLQPALCIQIFEMSFYGFNKICFLMYQIQVYAFHMSNRKGLVSMVTRQQWSRRIETLQLFIVLFWEILQQFSDSTDLKMF